MFKRLILIVALALPFALFGQQKQCDSITAKQLKTADIVGISMTSVGAVGLVFTPIVRNALVATVGETTKADYYIFGGIMATGIGIYVTSQIIGYKRAKNQRLQMEPTSMAGGMGLSLTYKF